MPSLFCALSALLAPCELLYPSGTDSPVEPIRMSPEQLTGYQDEGEDGGVLRLLATPKTLVWDKVVALFWNTGVRSYVRQTGAAEWELLVLSREGEGFRTLLIET